ncbi:GntR family transcriptional regulator [Phyllobacterium endophyticum]|uniref:GntR family transcriptional regulator n=1 Tax=Phyllobacterium endophyticum TaxID=1149773 RepID=UPI0011CAA77B|nr:GntR family transcriptional regulator [Phyllobacterium endophyticum]TXR47045.1 GntR family transcriptional regulator [Phyllobacterium endophyticum]
MTNATTPLQEGLIERIYDRIHMDGLAPGARLNEKQLAEQLNVSRSPIRAALDVMASRGLVVRRPQRGVELVALPPKNDPEFEEDSAQSDLLVKIARDRDQGDLGDEFSETELMQRYHVARNVVRNALEVLADLGMAKRKPGYGWRFLTVWNRQVRLESYRFRMIIEPAAILEHTFSLNDDWAKKIRRQHEASLTTPWSEASSVKFFEMNAAFHEGIAAASGNRFFLESMRRQNRLRRLANYNWRHGFNRVRENYAEHMAVLDQLEKGDFEMAALLMRRHLQFASIPGAKGNGGE